MIFWSGLGFLVIIIVFLNSFLAEFITRSLTNDTTFYQENHIPLIISLFASALIIYFFGKWLNTRKSKTFIDKETGKEIIFKKNHSFFFIPMEYWGIIISILTIILIAKDLLK